MAKRKSKVGRPPKYTQSLEIQTLFEKYVKDCTESRLTFTKAGLLFRLGLSRESYREYKAKPEFVDTIRQIEFLIEDAWLQRLTATGATGAIFYLKNAFKEEYKDRNETDVTSGGEKITGINYIVPNESKH